MKKRYLKSVVNIYLVFHDEWLNNLVFEITSELVFIRNNKEH